MNRIRVLWGVILLLVLMQVITFSFYIKEQKGTEEVSSGYEENITYGREGIAAQVGEDVILVEELIHRLIRDYGANVLEELINRTLIFNEAERLQLIISEDEIQHEIQYLIRGYNDEEEFYQALEEQAGIHRDELREEIYYYLLMEEMATRDIVITEEDLRTYYQENMDIFLEPTRFHLHQIIVDTEGEALQVIREIEQGSSFEAVAAEQSLDLITSSNGGDYGVVSTEDFFIPYEIIEVAEQIELDQLSSPIQLHGQYAVIKVSKRTEGRLQPFEEARGKIRRELALQQIDGISLFLERLKEHVGVHNHMYNP